MYDKFGMSNKWGRKGVSFTKYLRKNYVNPDEFLASASVAGSLKVMLFSHLHHKKLDTAHNPAFLKCIRKMKLQQIELT